MEKIEEYILKKKMKTMVDDGFERVKRGLTTIEEISRVVSSE